MLGVELRKHEAYLGYGECFRSEDNNTDDALVDV